MALGPTFRTAFLPAIDVIRGIPNLFGMRLYGASVLVRTWVGVAPGSRPGMPGASSYYDTVTPLQLDAGASPMTVRQVTQKEVIASGGLFQDQDLRIGPITPPYTGSYNDNDQISVLDPPVVPGTAQEVFYLLTGPDLGAGGAYFKLVKLDVSKPFSYFAVVRKAGLHLTPSPFSPAKIAGCQLWLRADLGITLAPYTAGVSEWADQTGNGNNVVQAMVVNQPAYVASGGANNQPYLSYTSAGQSLQMLTATFPGTQPVEVFMVARATGVGVTNLYLLDMGAYVMGGNANVTLLNIASSLEQYSGFIANAIPIGLGVDFVIDSFFNGGASTLALNGAAPIGPANAGATGGTQVTVGNFGGGGGSAFQGRIYEVAIYTARPTPIELSQLQLYFATRYAISTQ